MAVRLVPKEQAQTAAETFVVADTGREVVKDDLSAYDSPYHLLLEARESWEHVVSDKFVYSLNSSDITFDSLVGIAKDYIEGRLWIELHLISHVQRETHYAIIVECDQRARNRIGQFKINNTSVDGNPSMLVDVTKFVEPPETSPHGGAPPMSLRAAFLIVAAADILHVSSDVSEVDG